MLVTNDQKIEILTSALRQLLPRDESVFVNFDVQYVELLWNTNGLLEFRQHAVLPEGQVMNVSQRDQQYLIEAARLQDNIISSAYYVELYDNVLQSNSMTRVGIADRIYSQHEVWSMFSDFWAELPDIPDIRVEPFFQLCDICALDPQGEDDAGNW